MLAVQRNNPEVTEFLLNNGSDAEVYTEGHRSAKDNKGNTIAYYLVASF